MCAKADYREGFRVVAAELRRLMRDITARWQRRSRNTARDPVMPLSPLSVRTRNAFRLAKAR